MKSSLLLAFSTTLFGCAGAAAKAGDTSAPISRVAAEKIALARAGGGTVQEGELETEHDKLVWSFDIATPGTTTITEIQVDARSGEVVSVELEDPAKQQSEKAADAGKK